MLRIAQRVVKWPEPVSAGFRGRAQAMIRRYLEWNRGLRLDPWLRYLPAVTTIRRKCQGARRILDIGSGSHGLASYLQTPVIGVDLHFPRNERRDMAASLNAVMGSATDLPFKDRAFEVVVSMDTVEHLPSAKRYRAIQEMFRVTEHLAVFGFPFGTPSMEFDVRSLERERLRGDFTEWRREHVAHGLPSRTLHTDILQIWNRTRPEMALRWYSNENLTLLQVRSRLLELITRDSRLYGPIFLPLYCLSVAWSPRRGYRRIYVLSDTDPKAYGKG